jgi:putative oxidoreductase
MAHGLMKLGLVGGSGMRGIAAVRGTAGWFGSLGLWPPLFWAVVSILAEAGGGLLIVLGLGGPIGPGAVFGNLVIVTLVAHWPKGFWAHQGGIEFPALLAAGAFALALVGFGGWTVDAALRLSYPDWLLPAWLILLVGGDLLLLAIRASRTSRIGQLAA